MKEIHTFQLKEGINLHCIKETKFTAENISFFIQMKLTEKNAANAAVLSHILKYGCKNIPYQSKNFVLLYPYSYL